MKARVPSMGSTIQAGASEPWAGWISASSDSQPMSGTSAPRRSRRKRSTAMSASVTGDPPSFDQTPADVRSPERK
jgi:hypothetical protein